MVSPNGVQSGQMLFHDRDTGLYTPAVMQHSKAHFDISGMIATVSVEQSFRNDTGRALEGVYAFPLPDNAAATAISRSTAKGTPQISARSTGKDSSGA